MNRTARRLLPAVAVLAAVGIAMGAAFDPSDAASPTKTATRSNVQAPSTTTAPAKASTTTTAPPQAPATTTPVTKKGTPTGPATPTTPTAPRPDVPRHDHPRHDHPRHDHPVPDDPSDHDPSACFDDYGEFLPATEAEFRRTITRAWLLCEGPSFLGTMEAGIELRADGRWSKLYGADGDALVRAAGPGEEGSWETLDVGPQNGRPVYQLTFHIDGVGTVFSLPVFGQGAIASAPSMVRINNLPGLLVSDYVPVPPGMTILPAPAGEPCNVPADGSYSPSSEPEFRDVMTGAWLLCGAPSLFGTEEAGLELRPDGRWSKLEWAVDGSLVRAVGPEDEGSWETVDISEMNGRDLFSLELTMDGGGWISVTPVFAGDDSHVTKVRMDNMATFVADYVPTDGPVEGC